MAQYDFITTTGTIVADTSKTKAEVEAEQRTVFGEDVDLSDESPNGVLVNAEVISRNGVALNNAALANQINPQIAGGVFLDAIWALTSGVTGGRRAATYSTFNTPVDLTGVPGTIIPSGSLAKTVNGDEFESLADVTLDATGKGAVAFKAVETGAVAVAVGELNTLAPGAPLGWETVNNTTVAITGSDEESDAASRQRRIDTMALQGISVSEAVSSAVMALDGVLSLAYLENYTKSDATIDGILLLANSVYVCVDGGLDADIAESLLQNKTVGADWNGSVTVNVTDPTSLQSYPVKFERPTEVTVWVRVTIAPTTISNPAQIIDDAVLKYVGLDYGVGVDVSPFEIASAVNAEAEELFVKKVELSLDGLAYSVAEIVVGKDEVPRTSQAEISTVIA